MRRARAIKVMSSRIAAGTAYSAVAAASGLRVGRAGVIAGVAIGVVEGAELATTGGGTIARVTGAVSGVLPNRAGVSTFQLGRTNGAKAMMTSASRPICATHERSAAERDFIS